MIVFQGELSKISRKFIYKGLLLINVITMTIVSIIIAVPLTFAVVCDDIIWACIGIRLDTGSFYLSSYFRKKSKFSTPNKDFN